MVQSNIVDIENFLSQDKIFIYSALQLQKNNKNIIFLCDLNYLKELHCLIILVNKAKIFMCYSSSLYVQPEEKSCVSTSITRFIEILS